MTLIRESREVKKIEYTRGGGGGGGRVPHTIFRHCETKLLFLPQNFRHCDKKL